MGQVRTSIVCYPSSSRIWACFKSRDTYLIHWKSKRKDRGQRERGKSVRLFEKSWKWTCRARFNLLIGVKRGKANPNRLRMTELERRRERGREGGSATEKVQQQESAPPSLIAWTNSLGSKNWSGVDHIRVDQIRHDGQKDSNHTEAEGDCGDDWNHEVNRRAIRSSKPTKPDYESWSSKLGGEESSFRGIGSTIGLCFLDVSWILVEDDVGNGDHHSDQD